MCDKCPHISRCIVGLEHWRDVSLSGYNKQIVGKPKPTLRPDRVTDCPCAICKFSQCKYELEREDTNMKVKEVATTCFERPATFPDMTARLRTATAPKPCVQLFNNNVGSLKAKMKTRRTKTRSIARLWYVHWLGQLQVIRLLLISSQLEN